MTQFQYIYIFLLSNNITLGHLARHLNISRSGIEAKLRIGKLSAELMKQTADYMNVPINNILDKPVRKEELLVENL